jgi:hypothetical protein
MSHFSVLNTNYILYVPYDYVTIRQTIEDPPHTPYVKTYLVPYSDLNINPPYSIGSKVIFSVIPDVTYKFKRLEPIPIRWYHFEQVYKAIFTNVDTSSSLEFLVFINFAKGNDGFINFAESDDAFVNFAESDDEVDEKLFCCL